MYTQRKKERRCFSGKTLFPLMEKGDCLVEKDRRCIPDRRLGNIHHNLTDTRPRLINTVPAPEATEATRPGKLSAIWLCRESVLC